MKEMDQALREKYARLFVADMKDSYPSLTVQAVREKLDAILDGNRGKDIISLFMIRDLEENGYIEE